MGPLEAIKTCFAKSFQFKGRASRSEFWWFFAFLASFLTALTILNVQLFGPEITQRLVQSVDSAGQQVQRVQIHHEYNAGWFGTVFGIVTFLPWLAVGWRRMHDHGRAGYLPWATVAVWIIALALFVAFSLGLTEMVEQIRLTGRATVQSNGGGVFLAFSLLGVFILNFYWLTLRSDSHPNKYGPNPHEAAP